ncbi:hypothetical protein AYO38_04065 [bacterium SCGC AG-212-C10]|nr:hypothetical protein AYO38_04065 [bacterium SCGC AG-212-C10]
MEIVVIGIVRVLGSLGVLRWAFAGGIAAVLVDLSDLFLMNLLHLGGLHNYQRFDKIADLAYMGTFLWVSRRWTGPAKTWAAGLFAFRMVGLVTFELTQVRWILLLFPNVFEFWYLANAGILHFRPQKVLERRTAAILLAAVLPLKLFQEYALHSARWLDSFTAIEAVEAIWDWMAHLLY